MDVSNLNIDNLLPQRPPFRFVDRILDFEMEHVVTEFVVPEDNPLVGDSRLSEAGLVENIAQSCAARIGYICVYILKKAVNIGIIGLVRDMKINFMPSVGSRLVTHIELVSEALGLSLVNAEITCDGKCVATGQMKISLTDKPADN